MACYAKLKTNIKNCIVCGKEFADPQCNGTITCSKNCSRIRRKQMYVEGKYEGALELAHEAAKISPLTGRFETHMHAKEWIICSPDGNVHKCRNLKLWLRDHEDMIDGTVSQAWDGITKIKYSIQGKRKFKSYQWKGWKLLQWGD